MRKLMVCVLGAIALTMSACSSGNTSGTADNLNGTWRDQDMVATITTNHIEIQMGNEGGSALYWVGTFPQGSDHIVSVADKKALEGAILGSVDDTKLFTYNGHRIMFQQSLMGVTRTLHLKKEA